MTDVSRSDLARASAAAAKDRLNGTVAALKARLDPQTVAKQAVEGLVDHSAQALHSGVETVKRNPAPALGAAAVVAAFFSRKWLLGLATRKLAQPAPVPSVRSSNTRPTSPKRTTR